MRIDGIDAIDAFLESARADAGVDELCRFTEGDLCAVVAQPGSYDLVIFGSVGPILGGITKTVTHLMASPMPMPPSFVVRNGLERSSGRVGRPSQPP